MSKAIRSSPSGPVSEVITPVARAPLGIRVPTGPVRRDVVRAGILSPTLLLVTQTREPEMSVSRVPAGMVAADLSRVIAGAGAAEAEGVDAGAGRAATRDSLEPGAVTVDLAGAGTGAGAADLAGTGANVGVTPRSAGRGSGALTTSCGSPIAGTLSPLADST